MPRPVDAILQLKRMGNCIADDHFANVQRRKKCTRNQSVPDIDIQCRCAWCQACRIQIRPHPRRRNGGRDGGGLLWRQCHMRQSENNACFSKRYINVLCFPGLVGASLPPGTRESEWPTSVGHSRFCPHAVDWFVDASRSVLHACSLLLGMLKSPPAPQTSRFHTRGSRVGEARKRVSRHPQQSQQCCRMTVLRT